MTKKGKKPKNWKLLYTPEANKKRSLALKGRKKSEEAKKKMSETHKRIGTGKWMRGRKISEEQKKKISETAKRIGTGRWNKGRKFSEEHKKKISNAQKGEKCYLWQGGKSFEPYTTDWTKTLKRSIRERDKYTCQLCDKEPATHCHHIDYNKKNCCPENLITLCNSCHAKTNYNRNYWINYFIKAE